MPTGVESRYHLCSDDLASGPTTFLLLQLFNLTLQRCESNKFHDQVELNKLNEKFDNANKCWQNLVLSKIEEESQANLKNVRSYLREYIQEISALKSELQEEKTNCINTENTQKKTDLQKCEQCIWKFISKQTAEKSLFEAAGSGDSILAAWLVDIGTNVNALNGNSQTPSHIAAETGHAKVIQALVDRKANINVKDYWGWTPLHYCAWKNRTDACNVLINAGAVIDPPTNDGRTPLHRSVDGGFLEITKNLLDHGANPNSRDNWNWTPLFYCAWKGHLPVCTLLVDRGAEVNARSLVDKWAGTPLKWAQYYGHSALAQYLRSKGATL